MRGHDGEPLGIRSLARTAELEQTVGRAALAESELEELTADFVHVLAETRPEVGRVLTGARQHAGLIDWARKLAKAQVTDADLARDFVDWLSDVDRARIDRNELVHSTITVIADLPDLLRDRSFVARPALIRRRDRLPRPLDPADWDDLIRRMTGLLRTGRTLLERVAEAVRGA